MNTLHPVMQTALRPFMPREIPPSWKTMEQTLRKWHEQSLDDPEYLWMDLNFEDMADQVNKAIFCSGSAA